MKQQNKEQQFKQLIERDLPKLRGLAFRILKNANDTDDAIQDALVKAYQRFDTFRNESALSSWVCRITVTCSYDLLRKRIRERKTLQDYDPHPEPSLDTTALEEAIADLPEPYRDAITIGVLSGMDGKEAAEILGISQNALYQRVFKAKQMLKNAINSKENAQ
ncbi:MAG: RNA polymerase sigma factor [Victivallales bacterium]|nr:RNA polymerase sigma factor [Victivallales bacterium]